MIRLRSVLYLLVLTLFCCRKPYSPPAVSAVNSFLVIEGNISTGADSTIIKISKTVKLDSTTTLNPLLGATVMIESDQSGSWRLVDFTNNGHYAAGALGLPNTARYRLRVSTNGRQYLSDYIAVKPTPPIDSVGYILKDGVVNLYVNTHDPANNTHYYRWDYSETWVFHSRWPSAWIYDKNLGYIVQRTRDQDVYYCFGSDNSSTILLGSTAKLSKDEVFQAPITKIPLTSEKIESKYSILVRQYAIPPEAYTFYQNILKNTEQLGSIFDAQPTQLIGNIHSVTDPNEPVIGYLTVTNVQSKRIFIPTADLTDKILTIYPYACEQDSAFFRDKLGLNTVYSLLEAPPINELPTSDFETPTTGFLYAPPLCVDCTLRGTKTTPSFWK